MLQQQFDKHEFTLPNGSKAVIVIPVPIDLLSKKHLLAVIETVIDFALTQQKDD